MTAHRVRSIRRFLGSDETFLPDLWDGVGDIDIPASIEWHRNAGAVCYAHGGASSRPLRGTAPDFRMGRCGASMKKPQAEGGSINGGFYGVRPPAV